MVCMIGATEILLICGVVLLFFGGKKIPELMKGLGKGVRSYKEGLAEPSEEKISELVEEDKRHKADAFIKENDSDDD